MIWTWAMHKYLACWSMYKKWCKGLVANGKCSSLIIGFPQFPTHHMLTPSTLLLQTRSLCHTWDIHPSNCMYWPCLSYSTWRLYWMEGSNNKVLSVAFSPGQPGSNGQWDTTNTSLPKPTELPVSHTDNEKGLLFSGLPNWSKFVCKIIMSVQMFECL